jgi:hypothetical protein
LKIIEKFKNIDKPILPSIAFQKIPCRIIIICRAIRTQNSGDYIFNENWLNSGICQEFLAISER